ncbi:MAG: D-alanyl-D-alanine carboxypeptidase family protein [Candidatus Ornithomonoglobus sp.]
MKKKLSAITAIILIMQCVVFGINTSAAVIGDSEISSAAACVMDFETGKVLYDYNGGEMRAPASMTKVMAAYCVFETIAEGKVAYDSVVTMGDPSFEISCVDPELTAIGLDQNETYTVGELLNAGLVCSANDAILALAQYLCGDEASFVQYMNDTAARLGIDAQFYDSYGLKHNQISAIGMAELARCLIHYYPDVLNITRQPYIVFHGSSYNTTNHLLDSCYYEGADGLKTGTTNAAGNCLCGTAVRNGRRMIAVTMASYPSYSRYTDAAKLLDYGFAAMEDMYGYTYFTDIRSYIDGYEVPTFMHRGDSAAVIAVEDLANYGFDINYSNDEDTLYVIRNSEKAITPIPADYYHEMSGARAFTVMPENNIRVVFINGENVYEPQVIYNANGYMLMSIDEFANMFTYEWIDADMSGMISLD